MSSVRVRLPRHAPGGHRLRLRRAPARYRGLLVGRPDRTLRDRHGRPSKPSTSRRSSAIDARRRPDPRGLLERSRARHRPHGRARRAVVVEGSRGRAARPCRAPSSCSRCCGAARRSASRRTLRGRSSRPRSPPPGSRTGSARCSADDVERPKPAPDIYLEACRRLSADPADAVALEDTATGLAAARAAGMRTIGVPSVSTAALEADPIAGSLLDPAVLAALGLTPDG